MPRVAGQIDIAKTEAILDAAVEVIGQRGLGAPMEAIAKRAGVSKQTVYNHYGSKAELLRALIARRVDQLTAPLRDPETAGNPRQVLEALARSMLEKVQSGYGYSMLRVLIQSAGDMPDLAREIFEAGPMQSRRRLAVFLEGETRAGRMRVDDSEQAAEFFAGMVMGHSQLRMLLQLPSPNSAADHDRLAAAAADRFMRAYGV